MLRWQAQQTRLSATCVRLDRTGLDLVSEVLIGGGNEIVVSRYAIKGLD